MKAALVIALTLLALAAWALQTPDLARTALEQRYLQAPSDMVQVLGTTLHVRESGPKDAPAVLLLHGFGQGLETWETWTPALSAGLRVLRIGLPGNGMSPPDSRQDYSDTRSIALISALLDARGIQKTHVLGHSIGGRIAWTFAATEPNRVDKLVLLASDGFASPGFAYGVAPEVPATLGLLRWTLPRWLLRMNLGAGYAEPKALSQGAVQRYHDLMRAPGARQALLSRLQQTGLVDPVPLLKRITGPTLLVWGRDDAMIPFSNAAKSKAVTYTNKMLAHPAHAAAAPGTGCKPGRLWLAWVCWQLRASSGWGLLEQALRHRPGS